MALHAEPSSDGTRLIVSGSATYQYRNDFKALGGHYLPGERAWAIPMAQEEKVHALVARVNPTPYRIKELKAQLARLYQGVAIPDKFTRTELHGMAYNPPDGLVAYAGPTAEVDSQPFPNGWTYYTRTTGDRTIRVVGFDHS